MIRQSLPQQIGYVQYVRYDTVRSLRCIKQTTREEKSVNFGESVLFRDRPEALFRTSLSSAREKPLLGLALPPRTEWSSARLLHRKRRRSPLFFFSAAIKVPLPPTDRWCMCEVERWRKEEEKSVTEMHSGRSPLPPPFPSPKAVNALINFGHCRLSSHRPHTAPPKERCTTTTTMQPVEQEREESPILKKLSDFMSKLNNSPES